MDNARQQEIFGIILKNEPIATSGILEKLIHRISIPTLNRELSRLKADNFIIQEGNGPATKYRPNLIGLIHADISPELYFKVDIDDRKILHSYNPVFLESLKKISLFTNKEVDILNGLTKSYQAKLQTTSPIVYKKEFERLMIELSWKSSQIEGNTYDLLDTEQLLKYNIVATSHTEEEATMLLNHKSAIQYTSENSDLFNQLSVSKIIDIHSLLTQKLGISKGIRSRLVRITGTKYTPPDNQFVIEEALESLCASVNTAENTFEKALRALLLISYIQPFEDGNKRTARLTANALLMANTKCPLSYRSVNPSDYKKAVLLFYEMNSVVAFKKLFIEQYTFAVENYF